MRVCTSALALALAAGLAGCANSDFIPTDSGPTGYESGAGPCKEGEKLCSGGKLLACKEGTLQPQLACQPPQICSQTLLACAACEPGQPTCVGDEIHACDAQGKPGELKATCPPEGCTNGVCIDACSQAAAKRSYIGCSYWPTVTLNSQVDPDFSFAVVVANAQTKTVKVTVSSAKNASVATAEIAPNSTATIKLPWVTGLKQDLTAPEYSLQQDQGAYHLVSSLPVTAYQFNALEYMLNQDCTKGGTDTNQSDGKCYSYTNDASLLLPDNALYNEYIVISRPTMFAKIPRQPFGTSNAGSSGFFAVTAVRPGTTTVRVHFSTETQAGKLGGLAAFHKGQTAEFKLPQHAVLQILSQRPLDCTPTRTDTRGSYCDLKELDLTGTRIVADQDVAVFAGHNCAFVPFDKWACDHLEEQMFPLKSWGKHYIATQTISSKDPSIYRVVSGDKGNTITFSPAAVQAQATLDEGQYLEFTTDQDFEVSGSGRFAVVQFMVGQNYAGATEDAAPGDPSMSLAVPVEQYRKSYRFLAPETYDQNFVNITAPLGADPTECFRVLTEEG